MKSTSVRHEFLAHQVVEVIHERYSDPALSVADVARSIGVSERQVRRVLDAGLTSFREELLLRRMERGAEILTHSTFRVSNVARLVGYESPPAFAAAFKRHFGVSPVQWRVARGGPRRAGGPTGAFYRPADRARARRRGQRLDYRRSAIPAGDYAVIDAQLREAKGRIAVEKAEAGLAPVLSIEELAKEAFRGKRKGPGEKTPISRVPDPSET